MKLICALYLFSPLGLSYVAISKSTLVSNSTNRRSTWTSVVIPPSPSFSLSHHFLVMPYISFVVSVLPCSQPPRRVMLDYQHGVTHHSVATVAHICHPPTHPQNANTIPSNRYAKALIWSNVTYFDASFFCLQITVYQEHQITQNINFSAIK